MLNTRNVTALIALSFMTTATASELSIGAGAVYNESPYRGYNENTHVVPLISYEGESLYIRQTTLGYILSKSDKNEISITASWMPLEFSPSDNDDYAMSRLDKRDSTAMAGAAWYHHEKWGSLKVSAATDILDNSDGWVAEMSLFRVMPLGKLTLTPSAGVLYYDKNFNDYYYGISSGESHRSGLSSYSPDDSWTPYVGIGAKYPLTKNIILQASAMYSVLPDDIKNSPMVDREDSFTFLTGASWHF
jgi:MipA family protein